MIATKLNPILVWILFFQSLPMVNCVFIVVHLLTRSTLTSLQTSCHLHSLEDYEVHECVLPTPDPSQEGNLSLCTKRKFPSWEGSGVGSPGFRIPITFQVVYKGILLSFRGIRRVNPIFSDFTSECRE